MEIWKDVVGYEGLYEVSSLGRVKSYVKNKSGRILKNILLNSGYETVGLFFNGFTNRKLVHRLVAESFICNPDLKNTVNHIDGIKNNNFALNLEWSTQSENITHAHKNGLVNTAKGERNGCSKLNYQQIIEIRASNFTNKKLAEIYSVSQPLISQIKNRKKWNHLL